MIRPLLLAAAAFALLMTPAVARAADSTPAAAPAAVGADTSTAFTPAQKTELGKLIHAYILQHPDVLIEGLNAYQQKQQEVEAQNFDQAYPKYKDFLTSATTPFGGNPKGTHVIVEFFDYNCGYCKKAVDDVVALIKADPQVKVYFKDMPILAPTSSDAAKWALAAGKQGKYFEYHVALMHSTAPRNKETFKKIGTDLGLDVAKLETDAENDVDIADAIAKNLDAAKALAIQGTPGFIIGGKLTDGYMGGLQPMQKAVADAYSAGAPSGGKAK